MFGISPLGWIHTLGSLPAIPMAVYMFARYGWTGQSFIDTHEPFNA